MRRLNDIIRGWYNSEEYSYEKGMLVTVVESYIVGCLAVCVCVCVCVSRKDCILVKKMSNIGKTKNVSKPFRNYIKDPFQVPDHVFKWLKCSH